MHWLSYRFSTITLPGIERQEQQVVQLPLDTVYVPLQAKAYWRNKTISMRELLQQGQRLVITGGPGSGKTTVLLHIARTLALALQDGDPAWAEAALGLTGDLPLPIFVTLSGFARHVRDLTAQAAPPERTLAGYISRQLIEKQSGLDLPADFFQRLLVTGQHVLLLLDGLDEVPDEDERALVREAIEELLTGRDALRVVVTCRTAAYRGRTALRGVTEIGVQPLAAEHIRALITQAYASLHPDQPAQQHAKADELVAGIERLEAERRARLGEQAERLVTSPLLVRMLLIVHIRDRRLPEQRAELYQKAVEAMLKPDYAPEERVTNDVGQWVGGSMEAHRELVQTLAFAMHQRGGKQGREIDEDGLKRALAHTPTDARELIAITRTRGTVLEERDRLYRFIHLGFQEFLVARYLAEVVRGERGVHAIAAFLEEENRLLDSWWREMVLLVVGYLALISPGNARTLIERLGVNNPHPTADVRLAASKLAMLALMESFPQATDLRQALGHEAAALISQAERHVRSQPAQRVGVGRVLSTLGDPRPGVGVLSAVVSLRVSNTVVRLWGDKPEHIGLPDITWVKVPGVQGFRLQTDKGDKGTYDIPPFYLAQYPVTTAQFQTFVDADDGWHNPRWWAGLEAGEADRRAPREPAFPYDNHPRESVSWWDAVAFGRWLSARLGWADLPADLTVDGLKTNTAMRLPTEWEWQWAACPRQPQTAYPWGG